VAGFQTEVVIDSSIAVKWFSIEDATDKALILRNEYITGKRDLWVSDLLYHEVANALRYKPDFDEKKLTIPVQDLFGYHLNTRAIGPSGDPTTAGYFGVTSTNGNEFGLVEVT